MSHISTILLKLALSFTLLFTTCISIIHAMPYQEGEAQSFLTPPDGCSAPCFIGIRPGVTTAEEAVTILETHEWIGDIELTYNPVTGQPDSAIWGWSGSQSRLIQDTLYGSPYRGNLRIEDGIVTALWIPTRISIGDLWLQWGRPDEFTFNVFRNPSGNEQPFLVSYFEIFADRQVISQSFITCPYFPIDWYSPVAITLGDASDVPFISETNTSTLFPDFILSLKQWYC